jgi:signal transduction histidine kinase
MIWSAVAAPAPVGLEGLAVALARRFGLVPWRAFLACNVLGSGLLVFAFADLALLADGRASYLFVAFAALTAGLHSWNTKSSVEAPIMLFAAFFGIASAVVASRTADWLLVVMMSVLVLYLSLMMGTWSARAHTRLAAHREAIQAQLLDEHTLRNRALHEGLTRVLSLRHDQRNLAQAVALDLGDLQASLSEPGARDDLHRIAATFERLRELLTATPNDTGAALVDPAEESRSVSLADVVADVIGVAKSRYADPQFETSVSSDVPHLSIRGGASSLHRVLLNLVLNACEGDGTGRKARRIKIAAERGRTGRLVVIRLIDNGPGIPPAVLARRVPFFSSKPDGSGLGLLTAEAHVRASGGAISYANLEEGGAQVTLELPGVVS